MHTAPAPGPLAGQLLHLLHCVCPALYNVYITQCKLCKVLKLVAGCGSDAGGGPAAAWRPAGPRAPHTTASPVAPSWHPPIPRRHCGHRCPGWGLSIGNVSYKAHSVEMVLKTSFCPAVRLGTWKIFTSKFNLFVPPQESPPIQ